MHILLVADGRSPITKSWIKAIQPLGYRISLISTFPCESIAGVDLAAVLPVAFARFGGSQAGTDKPAGARKGITARFRPLLAKMRHLAGPFTVTYYQNKFKKIVQVLKPDLVHALRIPYEGMLATATPRMVPLLISTWGNDLTLHAPANAKLSRLTRRALQRADALLSDTWRDAKLALQWGFAEDKPALVVVGNGGLDLEAIGQVSARVKKVKPVQTINPRGLRSYVRNDTFFRAIPLVLAQHPDVQFVCPSMAGQKEALDWVEKLGIQKNVKLLPFLPQSALWEEFARSTISVSISEHDGTPNTLLEAMAFGCLPVCGDIESIREWIEPGVNGELVSPDSPEEVAAAISRMLANIDGYETWKKTNLQLVQDKAEKRMIRSTLDRFYKQLTDKSNNRQADQ